MPRPTGTSRLTLTAAALAFLAAAGCEGERTQSMLHPAGPSADQVAMLWWIMFGVYGGVFVVTLVVLALALIGRRREKPLLGPRFVFTAGVIIPTLILIVMLIYTVIVTVRLSSEEADLRVRVIGHQWWWEVRYPDLGITGANEIHLPAGVPVRFELESADVVHSLWIPELAGKRDLLPGKTTELTFQADRPGIYRGQCAEFCGTQHALMAFWVVVHEPEEFQRWLEQRKAQGVEPAPPPDPEVQPIDPQQLQRGQRVFLTAGCATCHRIEGVSEGEIGPDLTHLGSRLSLGAGVFRNTRGNLAGWIADPQSMKPGALMPPTYLPPEDLHALVDYLRSLQ